LTGRYFDPPVEAVDADGAYAFTDLTPGWYRVVAVGDGGSSAAADVEVVAPRQRVVADLRLHAPAGDRVLRGHVIDVDGRPARGFVYADEVGGASPPARVARLAADGSFELSGLADGKVA